MTTEPFSQRKADNRRVLRDEMRGGVAALSARPRVLFVELSRFCNLACPMCRVPGQITKSQTMSEELFARVAEDLFPTAELVDLRGWGESLIVLDFPSRVRTARSYGCEVRVVTNLSFHRREALDALIDARAYVGVSVDAASPELLRRLRGGANLARIRANLAYLGTAYARSLPAKQ